MKKIVVGLFWNFLHIIEEQKKEDSVEDRNKEQIIARSNLFNCNKIIPPHLNVLAMALFYISHRMNKK